MVRLPRDFENDLLLELRTFARCKLKRNDPNHFCSNREFQQNLKMSARDVGKTLSNLVKQEKIKHEININRKKTLNKKKSNFQIRLQEAMKANQKVKKRKKN